MFSLPTEDGISSDLSPLPDVGFGVVFLDYDNDTHLDSGDRQRPRIDNVAQIRKGRRHAQKRLLLRNTGTRLEYVSDAVGPDLSRAGVGRGLMAGDIDNDGNLDLLVTNNGGPAVLLKNGGGRGNALEIRWPSGLVERIRNVAANQLLTIREGSGITAAVPVRR